MANEGEFPKVDGDTLFATEVNQFQGCSRTISVKNDFDTITSGTAFQDIGSIVIPAGSLANPAYFEITAATGYLGNTHTNNLQITFSGTAAAIDSSISGTSVGGESYFESKGFLGTSGPSANTPGFTMDRHNSSDQSFVPLYYTSDESFLSNCFPNSGLVILFSQLTNGAGAGNGSATLNFAIVKSWRGDTGF